jgi:hypothetical protein
VLAALLIAVLVPLFVLAVLLIAVLVPLLVLAALLIAILLPMFTRCCRKVWLCVVCCFAITLKYGVKHLCG